jgi:hypothetical protein
MAAASGGNKNKKGCWAEYQQKAKDVPLLSDEGHF